jgi:cysteine desulfurase
MRRVYLDNAATTPLDERVFQAMLPYFKERFGNPASLHSWGEEAKNAIETARTEVANLIGSKAEEIIFTSSGSEANNLAIKGLVAPRLKKGNQVIISQIEHFSVLHAVKNLEKAGVIEAVYLPVDKYGLVDPEQLKKAITPRTILISIMHANGEVGTIEPISDLAKIAREHQITFHTDAVASAGAVEIDVNQLGVDALSLAGSQFYGPKGSAALYVRRGVRLKPQIDGGIQENGRRAGTENVPAIVGLGKAAQLAKLEMQSRSNYLIPLRDKLIKELAGTIDHLSLNGHPNRRLPGNVHVRIEYIEGESMLIFLNMQGIAAASGSACTSKALKASHVLTAMGVPHEKVHGSLLFSLGKENTLEDIEYVVKVLPPIVERLRQMSPMTPKEYKTGAK